MSFHDIVTIGSATRDVFLESDAFRDVKLRELQGEIAECLPLGTKNEVQKIFFSTGGGATNSATTFARLGLETACLARVGNDSAGNEIVNILKTERINTSFIQIDQKENTAYSTLLMHGPGERTVLVYRGPSSDLELGASVLNKLKAQWFYVTSLGGRLDLVKKIWKFAHKNNIKIAWNPGGEELRHGLKTLEPFIKQCALFNVNREEGAELTKFKPQELKDILKKLNNLASIVLLTEGKSGAHCLASGKKYFVSSLGTKARNTTGAGDAFGSAFVAGLFLKQKKIVPESRRKVGIPTEASGHIEGQIKFALRLAILNADSVIRRMGAKSGILKKMPNASALNKVHVLIHDFRS